MSLCDKRDDCLFFNSQMKTIPVFYDEIREAYCRKDYTKCARYMIYNQLGSHYVPVDMLPEETGRAEALIKEANGL